MTPGLLDPRQPELEQVDTPLQWAASQAMAANLRWMTAACSHLAHPEVRASGSSARVDVRCSAVQGGGWGVVRLPTPCRRRGCSSGVGQGQRGEDGRVVCTIVDDQPRRDGDFPDQIGPWRDAVRAAAERVGTLPLATWNALLGPFPQPVSFVTDVDGRPAALAGETSIGPLRLLPGGMLMHEMAAAHPLLLGDDRYPYSSSPLIVQGTAASYGEYPGHPTAYWPMDELAALRHMHRVAALVHHWPGTSTGSCASNRPELRLASRSWCRTWLRVAIRNRRPGPAAAPRHRSTKPLSSSSATC